MENNVSIIIPAYNEENGIIDVINEIETLLVEKKINNEIIIVDDGSTDKTKEKVSSTNARLIEHQQNRGYGAALKTGIKASIYDQIAIIDADGTYPVNYLIELIDNKKNYDMVVGARTGKNVSIPLIRRPAKWALNKLANFLTNYKIPDLNSGLRLFKKNSLLKFLHILPDGFSFTTTITIAMITNNFNVKYIPIDYEKRIGKSKIRPIYDTLNFISLITRMVIYFKPLRVLMPIGLTLLTIDLVKIIYDIQNYDWHIATSTILLGIIAFNTIILALVADMITTIRNAALKD
jgi:glycosyltransferase involved in cell wall biosynthesis